MTSVVKSATEASLRRRSQVVRQRFAKPPYVSSTLTGASDLPPVVVGMFPIADPGARAGAAPVNATDVATGPIAQFGERVRASQAALWDAVHRHGAEPDLAPYFI